MNKVTFFIQSLLFFLYCLIPLNLFCAWEGKKPEKVYSVVYVQKPEKWYLEQADLWQKEIEKNEQNAEAWLSVIIGMRLLSERRKKNQNTNK